MTFDILVPNKEFAKLYLFKKHISQEGEALEKESSVYEYSQAVYFYRLGCTECHCDILGHTENSGDYSVLSLGGNSLNRLAQSVSVIGFNIRKNDLLTFIYQLYTSIDKFAIILSCDGNQIDEIFHITDADDSVKLILLHLKNPDASDTKGFALTNNIGMEIEGPPLGLRIDSSSSKSFGGITAKFVIALMLSLMVVAPPLCMASVYLMHFLNYIPIVPYLLIDTAGSALYGTVSAIFVCRIAKVNKIDNSLVVLIIALASACVILYINWCVYIPLVYADVYGYYDMPLGARFMESLQYFIRPDRMVEAIVHINKNGVWDWGVGLYASGRTHNNPITGLALLLFWIWYLYITFYFAHLTYKREFLKR